MKAVNPAVSCKRNRPRLMNFLINWDFLMTMYIYIHRYLQILQTFRMYSEIKLCMLGMRLLLNPNKYGLNSYLLVLNTQK